MTGVGTPSRRPGRPRKFGDGRKNTTVRFTPQRYADLKMTAEANGRSISEEVEARIEKLMAYELALGETERKPNIQAGALTVAGATTVAAKGEEIEQIIERTVRRVLDELKVA